MSTAVRDSSSSHDAIPWVHTNNIKQARVVLQQMFDHFKDDSAVKLYLRANGMHLLEAPVGDTGIPKDIFNFIPDWSSGTNWSSLPPKYNGSVMKGLDRTTGVYGIYSPDSQKYCIGSAVDFDTRFNNHYDDSLRPTLANRPLYAEVARVGGWDQMTWSPIKNTPNHTLNFLKGNMEYSGDYKVFNVLRTFTQYEARIYEQALKSLYEPALNGGGDITFTNSWDPNDVRPRLTGDRVFTAITENGKEYSFDSMISAQKILGTSRKTISTVMNYPEAYVYCSNLDTKARFFEAHMPLKEGSPYHNPYLAPDHEGIDYSALPDKGILAFNENYEWVQTFDSSSDASHQCGFGEKYYKVSRHINKRFIACTLGGIAMKLLFAQNPNVKGGRKAVLCLNLETNETKEYKSVNDCVRRIGLSINQSSGIISDYIKPGKDYSCNSGKYRISYKTS